MKFTQAGLTVGLLIVGFLCAPLTRAEYQDPPHVTPAVNVTEREGTTGTKADTLPNATGWDKLPWGDTAAGFDGSLKIRVLTRTLNPPGGYKFAQYPEDNKWYDSIPGDTDNFAVGDFTAPCPTSISVYRAFFNTKVPDADNFPWRLEGNLGREGGGGGGGGGQFHWGAKITKPALPGDLAFVFCDRPKIGQRNWVYVGLWVVPSQAIVDALANAGDGYIITKRTQTYTLNGQEVTEVVYYGGKLPATMFVGGVRNAEIRTLNPDHSVYYVGGTFLGGPHMTSDGRIALEYDVLINNPVDWTTQPLESPITVAIETKVFSGTDPDNVFGQAVSAVPAEDRNRTGRPDENEYAHKSNAYFGVERENTPNPNRDTLWNGVEGCTHLKTATCTFGLPNCEGYTSQGIQDPPEDINSRVNRPVNMGGGRYEEANPIPKQ